MSTVDDMTFLKLMVGSLLPNKKESGNPVEHFSEWHNGQGWKLVSLNLHGLNWRENNFLIEKAGGAEAREMTQTLLYC